MKALIRRLGRSRSVATAHSRNNARPDRMEQLRQQLPDATLPELELIASVEHLTMTSPERILALCQAIEYVATRQIPGDIVECGVWRGGSMVAAAKTLIAANDFDRQLWLYDTFEGMSDPGDEDVDFLGHAARGLLADQQRVSDDRQNIWCYSPLEQVQSVMTETGYSADNLHYVVGKVEQTLPQTKPDQIALLRLDTDWYESTRCELEQLFPRLVDGGVLIIDDYGHWEGCRRAVDEYLHEHSVPMLLHRIDYTGRIGIVRRSANGSCG